MPMTYLGIDVGGTKIQGAYFTEDEPSLTARSATPVGGYEDFLRGLQSVVQEVQASGRQIGQISIGIPGTVTDQSVIWVPNLPFLNGKDLAGELTKRLGIPIMLANDAQLALLGEVWRGAARGYGNVALVSVGTGVGGAIMVDGKIVRGAHGSAGAFGWLNLDWREAADPEHGYVERHVSGSALSELARQLDPPTTSYEIIARARRGEIASIELLRHFSAVLGAACASIASILDLEVLLLAGGLTEEFDLLSTTLHEKMRELGSPGARETAIIPARLGKHAAAYGALRAAMPPRIF